MIRALAGRLYSVFRESVEKSAQISFCRCLAGLAVKINKTLLLFIISVLILPAAYTQTIAHKRAASLGTGMNLSYLEHHWKGSNEKGFSDFYDPKSLPSRLAMIRSIAAHGYQSVRLPVCFSAIATKEKPYRWINRPVIEALDQLINTALQSGLRVIIDQHHPELNGSIKGAADIERVSWLWREIASRYRSADEDKVLFELWNEPHDIDAKLWRSHARRLISEVRSIAPNHTLIVGFHDWNSRKALIDSEPFEDENLIYTFHFYDPFLFTHQGAGWSADGLADAKGIPFPWNKNVKLSPPASAVGKWTGGLYRTYQTDSDARKISSDIGKAKAWSKKHKVPIFAGEFGAYGKHTPIQDRCRYLKTVYSAFKKYDIPNAAWEWDGGFGMLDPKTGRLINCASEAAGYPISGDWRLVWSDEFDGPEGSGIDDSKWTAETGGQGWGNQEFQYYTDSRGNAYLDGKGHLVIKASKNGVPKGAKCWYGECRFTSARLITKGKFARKYGKFEARIKVPFGNGIWPAFWMLGTDIDRVSWPECGEIDVMENIGREPRKAYGTIHGPGYSGAGGIGKSFKLKKGQKFSDNFHVFTVEWEENEIRWYIDGRLYQTRRPSDLPKDARWVFDKEHFLLLNLAVGGNWPGSPDETTVFPQYMTVDYVRVYSRPPAQKL